MLFMKILHTNSKDVVEECQRCFGFLPVSHRIVIRTARFLDRFITRDSIYAIARICYGNFVCLSVCPSVTRVDQSKTVEARITQFSPYSSPVPLVFRG